MNGTPIRYISARGLFWITQAALVPFFAMVTFSLIHRNEALPVRPKLNEYPRTVRPSHDYDFVITDSQLKRVLEKTRPKFSKQQPPKTNFVDHALRQWGVDAKFNDGSLSGRQMRQLLLNHESFRAVWGAEQFPLLNDDENGVEVTTQQGRSTVSHEDHLLGTLAEVGTPLSFPIQTASRNAVVADLLMHAINTFRLNQREYEWTILALAFYAADGESWYTNEKQQINFDRLAKRLMRQRQPQGVCYGQHRLYTLIMMLRINQQMQAKNGTGLLGDDSKKLVTEYLAGETRKLMQTQSTAGYWDGNWPNTKLAVPDPQTDELSRRILATGHTLEWWAMAPSELHPPRETIVRASQWLTKTIVEMDNNKTQKNYTFLTHAARSLALWRGIFPGEFEQHRIARRTRQTKQTNR